MIGSRSIGPGVAAFAVAWLTACASAPVVIPPPPAPELTFEQKMAWILRLEEDRLLESAEPPPPPPPPSPAPSAAARGRLAAVAPPPPPPPPRPSLLTLLTDREARIRRRAALAVGRTRLVEAVPALVPVLSTDAEPEVRQMAAFALGLLGDASAADPLIAALNDGDPLVQGRAAEALGLIAHKPAAGAIAAMMTPHTKAGALEGIAPDDLEYPKSAAVEAVRLGMYALVRLADYDALASVFLDARGEPISRWWPVAYAFRRVNDPRAGSVLLALLRGDGTFTRAFAARGLGVAKEARAVEPLTAVAANSKEVTNVRVEAVRALADLGATTAGEALEKIVAALTEDPNLRLEALTALGTLRRPASVDLFIDLLTDPWPSMRAAAFGALARVDADTFVTAISGLDPDPEWTVRAALATALGLLGLDRGQPRLLEMLTDNDQRVIPAVLTALVAIRSPTAEATLIDRLTADDPVVRQTAANGLVRLTSRNGVTPLVDAYGRAEKDPTHVARAAILAAVVELDRAAAQPLLDRALEDHDWAMRVRAAALVKTVDPSADVARRIRPAPPIGPPELNDLTPMINPTVSPVAYVDTTKGMIQIELAVIDAPRTVANFVSLARRNFLGASAIHRVVPNFVVQDGDPRGDGHGGPGYTIRDEINQRPYLRGTVGMALSWEDTGGSQFFITHAPQPHLDGRYTVFGRVTDGMDVVDRLQQGDQIRSVRIWDGTNWIGSP
jgi:cyclophilin family peptidyl-prolyl cis-trans isomerase/HEAT repeat protein